MKTTDLQDLIDWEAIMPMPRCAGGHDKQMRGLFKGATVLAHWNDGKYSGTVATAVRLKDGRYCWYQDSYGSCSGCDAWEYAKAEDVRALCIRLACDASVFDTRMEMLADMRKKDPASWRNEAGHELAGMIESNMEKTWKANE